MSLDSTAKEHFLDNVFLLDNAIYDYEENINTVNVRQRHGQLAALLLCVT